MSQSQSHIRFGIISPTDTLPAWQADCLAQVLAMEHVELAVVVVESPQQDAATSASDTHGKSLFWDYLERRLLSRLPLLKHVPLANVAGKVPTMSCHVSRQDSGAVAFAAEDAENISNQNLDFIIRFGAGRVEGAILDASRLGVWFIQLGDDNCTTSAPGFWEIYQGSLTSRCSLRRFGATQESDETLRSGQFKTQNASYSANLSQLLSQSARWLTQVCLDLRAGVEISSPGLSPLDCKGKSRTPNNFECLVFYIRLHINRLTNFCTNLFVHRHWGLALSFSPIEDLWLSPGLAQIVLLPPPSRATFHTDPFALQYKNGLAILHERWSSTEAQGTIAYSLLDAKKLDDLRQMSVTGRGHILPADLTVPVNMKFSHHSSYPYVFSHDGEHYCIPETSEAAKVSLYRCGDTPAEWVHQADIITGFKAVDSSVFYHNGKWWLFCTCLDDNPNSHLYIWHADELLGPWQAHGNNPVKMDICSSRPAGKPFTQDGKLYRPVQDSSQNYGGSISIQQVTELTPVSYREQYCGDLKQLSDNLQVGGMHTLSRTGDIVVLDYYRQAFLPSILLHRFKLYLQSKRAD